MNTTQYERRAPTPSLVELTGHQPGPPGTLSQYSYPAEFRSSSLTSRPTDARTQQPSFHPPFSSSIHSNPRSMHNNRDTELVMFQRVMGIAADPRDQTVIVSRREFSYPDKDGLLFTSPVHFPIVDERGNVEHYKVCEHVMDTGDPAQCKAFHTPVHTSTVSIREIHPEDTHFYSAAIIPRNHRMFTDHPSTSRMITVDHSVTYKQVANQYNSQQLAFARRYKDWIDSDSGRLRLSQERYITDMKNNIRMRDEVLRERKRELEKKITSGDVMSTLQDVLKQYDVDRHQSSSQSSTSIGNSRSYRRLDSARRDLREKLLSVDILASTYVNDLNDRSYMQSKINDLKTEIDYQFGDLRSLSTTSGVTIANQENKLHHSAQKALQQLEDMVNPLAWLREDEERLAKEKRDLRTYYRSLDWMN